MGHISSPSKTPRRVETLKVIWHFYANQVNMGDWASALGIRQFLSASIPEDVEFVDHFLSQELAAREVDEINKRADLVVVGGGGLWFRKDLPLGWYWNTKPEQLCAIRCPIILYSVGLNDVEYGRSRKWSLDQHAINGILQVTQRAALVGVRDHWTFGWLNRWNVTDPYLVPCPSMFLRGNAGEGSAQDDVIGINIAPLGRIRNESVFLTMMGKLLDWIIAKGFRVKYLCHSPSANDSILRLCEHFPGELIVPHNPFELLDAYASTKMIIGMRLHSILFSFNRDRPVFAMTYSRKCEALLKLLDIENYSIRWSPSPIWGVGPFALRKAKSKIRELLEHTSEFQHSWQYYRNLYQRYNEEFAARAACLL